jgi:hypothetical protein
MKSSLGQDKTEDLCEALLLNSDINTLLGGMVGTVLN